MVIWSTIFCTIFSITIFLLAPNIILQFTKNDLEMIRIGQIALKANALTFISFGFYTVYSALFLALGKGQAGFILGASRQGLCFIPIILILPKFLGLNGIIYSQPLADLLSLIITILMIIPLYHELNNKKGITNHMGRGFRDTL